MAKLFNNIRKKIVADKPSVTRTANYLKYAIGEIVLVVFGILIALSINNWAEAQKEQKTLHNIYAIVAQDLKNDIADINRIIKIFENSKPLFNKVLDGKMTKKDYLKCTECTGIILGFPDLSFDVRGYNLLKNYKNTASGIDSLSVDIVQFYTQQLNEIQINEDLRSEDFSDNYHYWKTTQSWFPDFLIKRKSDGFIDYAVNSQDYKNRVTMAYSMTNRLSKQYKAFSKNAAMLIKRIESRNTN
ncbi:MAG: DUF6090 family protein [Flavobacteriaceae bacterium]|nr:DUF6090 family protein [Flavobacteriaceae bacterium]